MSGGSDRSDGTCSFQRRLILARPTRAQPLTADWSFRKMDGSVLFFLSLPRPLFYPLFTSDLHYPRGSFVPHRRRGVKRRLEQRRASAKVPDSSRVRSCLGPDFGLSADRQFVFRQRMSSGNCRFLPARNFRAVCVAWVVRNGALRLVQVVNRSPDACGRGNSAGWGC